MKNKIFARSVLAVALVSAAASVHADPAKATSAPKQYVVQKGDTLYGIYRKTGVHPSKLKAWNGISNANVIKPGFTLNLADPKSVARNSAPNTTELPIAESLPMPGKNPAKPAKPAKTVEAPAKIFDYQTEDDLPIGQTVGGVKYSGSKYIESDTALELETELAAEQPAAKPDASSKPKTSTPITNSGWQWPVSGRVIENRGDGVIMYANYGDPIAAVNDGDVVYTGNGQGVIGQTIVIQHADGYMSIYGYCKKFLAKDGDKVTKGQAIAEVGSYKAQTAGVYLETRKHGKSIGPNTLLPNR